LELNQLETFLAVAEERSFSKAAVRLHRTQPAVSQVIRKLEAAVGETLFDRAARDGSLTAAGAEARGDQRAGRVEKPGAGAAATGG
jgi:DNA-binding transcriptional LysR family regulator